MNWKRIFFFLVAAGTLFAANTRQEELDALRLPEKNHGSGMESDWSAGSLWGGCASPFAP